MIIVYDVSVERVNKVCQFLRRFLNWVQNSVFEGELTKAEFARIEIGLKEIIDENQDSIMIYQFSDEKVIKRKHIGVRKAEPGCII